MRISHQYKFIFFANPKTGSETVRKILSPHSDIKSVGYRQRNSNNPFYDHMLPREAYPVFADLGWNPNDYFKFVFVRNPWARLVSIYEMIYAGHSTRPDFTAWLLTTEPAGAGGGGKDYQRWRRFGTYSIENFIKDDSGDILVDQVVRLEDIDRELPPLLERLGIAGKVDIVIPHINIGEYNGKPYTDYYTAEARNYVQLQYQYDISEFNYAFGTE